MRAIIIYYSYSGNTKKTAQVLSEYLGQQYEVQMLDIQALDESDSFLTQARRALFRKRAKINPVEFDLTGYDLICIGTPVWAFAPVPAINTYLDNCLGLEGKSAALFVTYGSGAGVNRCFNYIQEVLSGKGVREFKQFRIQQFKANDKDFINSAIKQAF